MGYDLHITRKAEWSDDEPEIALAEWLDVIGSDPEMRLDGSSSRGRNAGIAIWTAYSGEAQGNSAWFDYRNGDVVVNSPDREIFRKMWTIAQRLGARIQGDDGEFYDDEEGGDIPEWR